MDVYTTFHSLADELTGFKAAEVNRLMDQAISYVWGFQDAGGEVKDTQRSTEFGWAYGVVAARFVREESGSRPPIQDAWRSWQEHGEIRDYNGKRIDI